MFKNKKIVALALFAVMLLVPFASAFALVNEDDPAGWPTINWITGNKKYADNPSLPNDGLFAGVYLTTKDPGGVAEYLTVWKNLNGDAADVTKDSNGGTYTHWAKIYAKDGNKGQFDAHKNRILKDLKLAKEYYKLLKFRLDKAAPYTAKQFDNADTDGGASGITWDPLSGFGWGTGTGLANFIANWNQAKESVGKLGNNIEQLEYAIRNSKMYESFGDMIAIANGNILDANTIQEYLQATALLFTSWTPAQQAEAAPRIKKAFDTWKKIAEPAKVEAFLANIPDALKKILEVKAPKSLTKDGWKVEEVDSAPGALNDADELRIEKNAKGNYVAKLYKAGVEIASKGLVWVYQPTNGVKAKKIKVDGVETTFSVVDGCWKYAAEFKVK